MTATAAVERLRGRLAAGDPLLGTFLNLGPSVTAEIAGIAGFDWVVIDLEHGSGSEADLLPQLQALELRDVVPIVRTESMERPRFSAALDRGAGGIMVPRVETAAEASAVMGYLRYPPGGTRGVGTLNRACDFGVRTHEVVPAFNDVVLGVVQIESPRAVAGAADIAAVDGVDVLFVGPTDLSHGLGVPGDLEHSTFRDSLATVSAAARQAGKATGILAPSVAVAQRYYAEGFQLIAVGSDSSLMLGAMREVTSWRGPGSTRHIDPAHGMPGAR